jgi:heat shock protein HslJ
MRVLLVLAAIAGISACSSSSSEAGPPTFDQIGNATIDGLFDDPVTLKDGRWEGEPYVAEGASRPTAGLAGDLMLTGDLTDDGNDEAVAFLWSATGGSGTRNYIGVFQSDGVAAINIATALVGDRVQVRGGRIIDGQVELDVVQHGPDDAQCCPATNATRAWILSGGRLEEQPEHVRGRIGVADLQGTEWQLIQTGGDEWQGKNAVTFEVQDGRVGGQAPCNRYMGAVTDGEAPGVIEFGQLASTQMACADDETMRREQEFLATLGAVDRFSYLTGKLALSANIDGELRRLLFEPAEVSED